MKPPPSTVDLEGLVRELTDLARPDRRPLIVAIDGYSASGKSTVAAALAQMIPAAVVSGDDFYRDEPEAVRLSYDAAAGADRYFDWERMIEEAVLPLRAGLAAAYRPFDWPAGQGLDEPILVEPAPIVFVEGVYSARPQLSGLLDVTVLVDAPEDVRLLRRRKRHDPHDWEGRWDRAERWYFETIRPRLTFDHVVSGEGEVRQ